MKDKLLIFDVESLGLHGPGFAVGFVILDLYGKTIDEGVYAVRPESINYDDPAGLKWVMQNVHLKDNEYNCSSLEELRARFWQIWLMLKETTLLLADCPWPVETNFLSACVNDHLQGRYWEGPYPLLDIASFRFGCGQPAMETERRLDNELPAHHPLNDARQSARQLIAAIQESTRAVNLLGDI